MNAYDDLDRTLAAWFESDSLPGAPAGCLECDDRSDPSRPATARVAGWRREPLARGAG